MHTDAETVRGKVQTQRYLHRWDSFPRVLKASVLPMTLPLKTRPQLWTAAPAPPGHSLCLCLAPLGAPAAGFGSRPVSRSGARVPPPGGGGWQALPPRPALRCPAPCAAGAPSIAAHVRVVCHLCSLVTGRVRSNPPRALCPPLPPPRRQTRVCLHRCRGAPRAAQLRGCHDLKVRNRLSSSHPKAFFLPDPTSTLDSIAGCPMAARAP